MHTDQTVRNVTRDIAVGFGHVVTYILCFIAIGTLAFVKTAYITAFMAALAIAIVLVFKTDIFYEISKRLRVIAKLGSRLYAISGYVLHKLLTATQGRARGNDSAGVVAGMKQLHDNLSSLANEISPKKMLLVKLSIAIRAPLYFIQWALIGALVLVLFKLQVDEQPDNLLMAAMPIQLDLCLGVLIFVYTLRNQLDYEMREALQTASFDLTNTLQKRLLTVDSLPELSEHEAKLQLGEYISVLERKARHVRSFFSNGFTHYDSLLSMVTLWVVLLIFVSAPGALIALAATLVVSATNFVLLNNQTEDRKQLTILRARRHSLQELAADPGTESLRHASAVGDRFIETVDELSEEITSIEENARNDGQVMRRVSTYIYYSLYALSTTFPLICVIYGELSLRVGLLYLFSLVTSYMALNRIITSAERMLNGYTAEIDELEEIFEVIANKDSQEQDLVCEISNSEIRFEKLQFAYPFRPMLLRWLGGVTIPPTISVATKVKILAPPGAGSSTLMQLIVGELKPETGGVFYGDDDVSEIPLAVRRKTFRYIPDDPRPFSRFRVIELFQSVCGSDFTVEEANEILHQFSLGADLQVGGHEDYTGANTLIEGGKVRLSDRQVRLLHFALHYAGIKKQLEMGDAAIKVIAVDGTHKIADKKTRDIVVANFSKLANNYHSHATLIIVARSSHDLGPEDYVIRIVGYDAVPEHLQPADRNGSAVVGCIHRQGYRHVDRTIRESYRSSLKEIDASLTTS